MDIKLELVVIPVSDVDRAKAFYVDQIGFHADYDQRVSDTLRFVQLTPSWVRLLHRLRRRSHRRGARFRQGPSGRRLRRCRPARGIDGARRRDRRRAGAGLGIVHLLQRSRRQPMVGAATAEARLTPQIALPRAPTLPGGGLSSFAQLGLYTVVNPLARTRVSNRCRHHPPLRLSPFSHPPTRGGL